MKKNYIWVIFELEIKVQIIFYKKEIGIWVITKVITY